MRQRGYVKNLAVVLIAMIVICYGLYLSFQSPIGLAYEKNRVHHPAGFSIIAPPKWDLTIQHASPDGSAKDALIIVPEKAVNWPGGMSILKWLSVPDEAKMVEDKYQPFVYHDQPAWRRERETMKAKRLSIVFQSDGGWYEFKFERPLSEPIESWWKKFMESFKVETPTTPSAPASAPAA